MNESYEEIIAKSPDLAAGFRTAFSEYVLYYLLSRYEDEKIPEDKRSDFRKRLLDNWHTTTGKNINKYVNDIKVISINQTFYLELTQTPYPSQGSLRRSYLETLQGVKESLTKTLEIK